jgi:hypothetical protein
MRWTGQIFWLLASGTASRLTPTFFPPSPPLAQAIGLGKSYPVTAAQLLPILTGISRADPLIKLAKNCREK